MNMPVPKRYFHCSQEIIADPEMWEFTDTFGDRSIRTWLQILIYLDRSANQWRLTGDWLAVLSRTVRQSSANLRRQIGWLVAKGWLVVGEQAADGSPLLLKSPNWLKYNRSQEHKRNTTIPNQGAVNDPLLSFPSPTPNLSVPTPKIKKKKELNTSSTVEPRGAAKSAAAWDSYKSAYIDRYGVEPVRDKRANISLCQLVDAVGDQEAPQVAAFYLTHNDPFYVKKRHPPNLLANDASGLRTQWASGIRATSDEARNVEQRDNRIGQFDRVMAKLGGGS